MIELVVIGIALGAGYIATVAFWLVAVFGVTSAMPAFVVQDHYLRNSYKIAQEFIWLLAAALGGYVTASVSGAAHALLMGAALAGMLIYVLWFNRWEMRQRGMAHQLVISLISPAGVAAGYFLRARMA